VNARQKEKGNLEYPDLGSQNLYNRKEIINKKKMKITQKIMKKKLLLGL